MYSRRNLTLHFERVILILRGQKIVTLVPIIFINAIIPLLNILFFLSKGKGEDLNLSVTQLLQLFFPFLSVWLVIFALKPFVEEKGCELFYVNSDKTKLLDMFILFLIILFDMLFTSIPYFFIIDNFSKIFFKIILVCFFYFGITYCTTVITKAVTPTILLLTVYTLTNMLSPFKKTIFPFYYSPEVPSSILLCEIPLFVFGLLLLGMGGVISKKKPLF